MDPLPPRPGATPPLVIGVSLKMYFDPARSVAWSRSVGRIAAEHAAVQGGAVELFVLPSLPALPAVLDVLRGTAVAVGAQDLFWEDRGAYTGGVSGADLKALGCTYVEVGHVERRRWFGEDDVTVNLKLAAALRNGLTPVLCIGERVDQGPAAAIEECIAQLESSLDGLDGPVGAAPLVVAYEPEWAIGRDESAEPDHVRAVTASIAAHLEADRRLRGSTVVYGGSAGAGLLPRLQGAVGGLFLGRFAHEPAKLVRILDEAMAVS